MERDPEHPILQKPSDYSIGEFHYHVGLDGSEPHIDLVLHKGKSVRKLRFLSPQQLHIEDGFPPPSHGMTILDVTARKLDKIGVLVTDFQKTSGKVTFWARDVVDLDKVTAG